MVGLGVPGSHLCFSEGIRALSSFGGLSVWESGKDLPFGFVFGCLDLGNLILGSKMLNLPGTPRPTIYKWLFQLDDEPNLYIGNHHFHPFLTGCLGFQVIIMQ